jgi:ubiquinone/menaquinone biosynthesis C-methylase UbiE
MARVYDRVMRKSEDACLAGWRRDLLEEIDGRVLEVGAGTGVNLRFYPSSIQRLVMSEPDRHMRARLAARLDGLNGLPVELSDASADSLPFLDHDFDVVVCMLVLCSVPDLNRAIGEIRRVLSPGGRLVFMEHVAADDRPDRLKWQRRMEPLWQRVSGNCHLTRTTEEAIRDGGFAFERILRESMGNTIPLTRATIRGIAVRQP